LTQPEAKSVACPACGKPVKWLPENRFRPFCSARCKGIDLGAWAAESYRIAGKVDADDQLGDDALTDD
jgi:endogenous inhibitor of DNA gyrase (YacG/DUF329 family)